MGKPLKSILQPERFLATIAYDGTDFHGWQVNPNQRTVESTIEERLSRIFRTPIDVHGSGRTDAGVHSVGQRFHFDAFWPHPAKTPRLRDQLLRTGGPPDHRPAPGAGRLPLSALGQG